MKHVAIFLFMGLAGFLTALYVSTSNQVQEVKSVPTPTIDPFPTDIPTPTLIPEGPTIVPTFSPIDAATKLDRSDLSVSVKNGSGEFGKGSKMAEELRSFGYHVTTIGNADSFDYEGVTVFIKDEKKKYMPIVKKDISLSYNVNNISATLDASSSSDMVVIVGKD
jgi:hypothetical protein